MRMISIAARVTMGSIRMASVIPAANPVLPFVLWGTTQTRYMKSPAMIDGVPVMASTTLRTIRERMLRDSTR